jgi:tetratricopeptide (TPR) repeat protein
MKAGSVVNASKEHTMPALQEAQLRHAEYYTDVAARSQELYLRGGKSASQGLTLFDQERAQIDTGWAWSRAHTLVEPVMADPILRSYAAATALIGALRYDPRTERIPQLESVLAAVRRLGDRQGEGATLGNLGNAYNQLGELQRAIGYHQQRLAVAREIGDHRGEGTALAGLGLAHYLLGNVQVACEYYKQRLAIASSMGDRRGEGAALAGLGLTSTALGDVRQALEYHEQHLALAREIGDRQAEAQALGNLGVGYKKLGELTRAADYYEQQIALAHLVGDRRSVAIGNWNLGLLLVTQGELARALPLLETYVAYEEELNHPDTREDASYVAEIRARLTAQHGL